MTKKIVTRKGVILILHSGGVIETESGVLIPEKDVADIWDYLQSKRDKELGRWRHTDFRHLVVYPMSETEDRVVRVFNEATGQVEDHTEGVETGGFSGAEKYFEDHPRIPTARGTIIRIGSREFTNVDPSSELQWVEIEENGNVEWWTYSYVMKLAVGVEWELMHEGMKAND